MNTRSVTRLDIIDLKKLIKVFLRFAFKIVSLIVVLIAYLGVSFKSRADNSLVLVGAVEIHQIVEDLRLNNSKN